MPRLSLIEGARVVGGRGKPFGRVEHVLFHPSEPRPVGLQVGRRRLLYVLDRRPVFLPLSSVSADGSALRIVGKRPSHRASEREMGIEWDRTVIWRAMPVRTASGSPLGVVDDAEVSLKHGTLSWVELTDGAVANAVVGKTTLPAEVMRGFDGVAVVAEDEALRERSTGGLAAVAGTGAAHAKVGAEQMAAKAVSGAAAAVKMARRSEAGRRAGKMFGSLKKSVLDAMRADEEE